MLRSPRFLTVFSIVLILGVVAGTSSILNLRTASLLKEGVIAEANVIDLRIVQTGSQNSRTTNYRVFMRVDEQPSKVLSSDTDQATWKQLSAGSTVTVVYLPAEENVCMIGDRADVQRVHARATMVTNGALALIFGFGFLMAAHKLWTSCRIVRKASQSSRPAPQF